MTNIKPGFLDAKSEYLYDLLARIKQRPGMYMGKPSITRLNSFLDGYMSARIELGLSPTQQEQEFNGFQDWIQERFKIESSHGWASIILFYSADEKAALEYFFELLDSFRRGDPADLNQIWQENASGSTLPLTQETASLAD
ncbi:hypothetical protein K9N68_25885 [Kovacikia minuta CCNUW1]|uniref:hypothetical protein n=1 Tax=Kovacikia minuta TaxID=2931930 RepID=UPI001CC9030B|nr:hypothetical protein [Kovacikia minuta]UBF25038.1 hypothetical protein K9N68_25885 [Kovacikia minuta CCNUW1]